jgi:hypothetical protein
MPPAGALTEGVLAEGTVTAGVPTGGVVTLGICSLGTVAALVTSGTAASALSPTAALRAIIDPILISPATSQRARTCNLRAGGHELADGHG